jgi:hypothetical protein
MYKLSDVFHRSEIASFHLTQGLFRRKKDASLTVKAAVFDSFWRITDLGSSPLVAPQDGLCTTYCVFLFTGTPSCGWLERDRLGVVFNSYVS